MAVLNLLRLAQMTGKEEWRQKGVETIGAFAYHLSKYPTTMPQMLIGLSFRLRKAKQVIIAGQPNAEDTRNMLREIYDRFIPNKILLLTDGAEGQEYLAKYLPFIASTRMHDGQATAYICEDYTRKLPTTDVSVMVSLLKN